MPTQCSSEDVPAVKRTPSFTCEIPLRVTAVQERTLLVRLEAARQVYNACLGEVKRRVGLVRQSKLFQRARLLPKDDPERQRLFAQARRIRFKGKNQLDSVEGKTNASGIRWRLSCGHQPQARQTFPNLSLRSCSEKVSFVAPPPLFVRSKRPTRSVFSFFSPIC